MIKESVVKKRILDVASRLLYEQGYNATGINQIIDEADIAKASFYNHFLSKRDLLSAYIINAEQVWFEGLDNHISNIKDPHKKLLGLFDYRADRQLRYRFGGCQFNKASAEAPREDLELFELVGHQKDRTKQSIKQILSTIKLSQPQLYSIDDLAEMIFFIIEGATVATSIYKDAKNLRNAKKLVEKLL